MKDLMKCKLCGSMHEASEMYKVNPDTTQEFYVCNCCIHNIEIFKCIDCGNFFTQDYYWGCYQGCPVCQNCENHCFVCERCEGIYPESEINYDEEHTQNLCGQCMEESYCNLDNIIEDYYYKPDPVFHDKAKDNAFIFLNLLK